MYPVSTMEAIVLILAVCSVVYAIVATRKTLLEDYKLHKAVVACKAEMNSVVYDAMQERLRPVEDDVRPNSGHPLDESEYLKRADKMNADTKIFDWINSPTKQYEW